MKAIRPHFATERANLRYAARELARLPVYHLLDLNRIANFELTVRLLRARSR